MCTKSDEQVLYEGYMKLTERFSTDPNKNPLEADKKAISDMMPKFSLTLLRLEEGQMLTSYDKQKSVNIGKYLFIQISQIKKRHPECIYSSLNNNLEKLIKAICRIEAEMINLIRLQETGGERIDIEEIFSKKKYINRLGTVLAKDLVKEAMKDRETTVGQVNEKSKWYITGTGKKYHVADCPYCRGRNLTAATTSMIENQKLEPCKCVEKATAIDDKNCMTAFIDESIHSVQWTEKGKGGTTGSFSYIICKGFLPSEEYITNDNTLATGVDYVDEKEKVDRVTEAAIGKVMLSMFYDFNFNGSVNIYTDNLIAMNEWNGVSKNSKIAEQFESVTVRHIPREKNKKADALGRTKTYLCLSTEVYNSIRTKVDNYDRLRNERDMELLERKRCEEKAEELKQKKLWYRFLRWMKGVNKSFVGETTGA